MITADDYIHPLDDELAEEARFWRLVDRQNDHVGEYDRCWLWRGPHSKASLQAARRYAYEWKYGPVDSNTLIVPRNRDEHVLCVRPDHACAKSRQLAPEIVQAAIALRARGMAVREIAQLTGCSESSIYSMVRQNRRAA